MIALRTGMVLAAGLGTRMRPLTEHTPKPLLRLGGRTLLDHVLDRLEAAGVERAVVNAHHLGDQVVELCARRAAPRCEPSVEEVLLETGGGIRRALPRLGEAPFVVANGDAHWLDGPTPALLRMAAAFEPEEMDSLLLLCRTSLVEGEVGRGDFLLDPVGRVRRPHEREVAPYTFTGVQIVHPRLFADAPEGRFGMMALWERAIEAGRLWGLVHDGAWFHLSAPPDLAHAERRIADGMVRRLF